MYWAIPVLAIFTSLWVLLQVRPSAVTSRTYISPHGRLLMSQPVPGEQHVELPFSCSSTAVYFTALGTGDQVMLTVLLSQSTELITFWGGQGAAQEETCLCVSLSSCTNLESSLFELENKSVTCHLITHISTLFSVYLSQLWWNYCVYWGTACHGPAGWRWGSDCIPAPAESISRLMWSYNLRSRYIPTRLPLWRHSL